MKTTRYKVLLIDDDATAIELARSAVAEYCPEIDLTVVGGSDAVPDRLNGNVTDKLDMPHIILMNLKLPKLDGLAVLRKLRMHVESREIPIVAFSSEYTQDDVLMSYQVGANSFVPKPVSLEQFRELFRERLAYWIQEYQREEVSIEDDDTAG